MPIVPVLLVIGVVGFVAYEWFKSWRPTFLVAPGLSTTTVRAGAPNQNISLPAGGTFSAVVVDGAVQAAAAGQNNFNLPPLARGTHLAVVTWMLNGAPQMSSITITAT